MHIEDAAVANVQTSQSVMQLTDRGYSIEWQDKDIWNLGLQKGIIAKKVFSFVGFAAFWGGEKSEYGEA